MFWVSSNDGVYGLDALHLYLDQKLASYLRYPKILLAEDDDEMRRLLALLLLREGYEVIEARDGLQLLETLDGLRQTGPHHYVDLIISDIRMRGIDGLEVLRRLHLVDGSPPVILITAFGDDRTHELAREYGALALFDKPFDFDDFRAFIRSALPLPPRRETAKADEVTEADEARGPEESEDD